MLSKTNPSRSFLNLLRPVTTCHLHLPFSKWPSSFFGYENIGVVKGISKIKTEMTNFLKGNLKR